jgi:hypothetical protein
MTTGVKITPLAAAKIKIEPAVCEHVPDLRAACRHRFSPFPLE